MRTIDHAAISGRLAREILKIDGPIKSIFFRAGNLIPDYSYHTYCKSIGHGFSTARKKLVQAWQSKHFNGENAVFYYRLGIAAHYLCDSFTFVHNKPFNGTLAKHIDYENILHEKLRKAKGLKPRSAPIFSTYEACMRHLERIHADYLKRKRVSPENDIQWILSACRSALLSTVNIPDSRRVDVKRILA